LCASAFFSASETALFSLPRDEMALLAGKMRSVRVLAGSPRSVLVTVLLGNLAVNVLFFSIAAQISVGWARAGRSADALGFSLGAFVILVVCGEVLPKTYAVRNPRRISRVCARPLYFMRQLLWPVRVPLERLTDCLTGLATGRRPGPPTATAGEMAYLLDVAVASGAIRPRERSMLAGTLSLRSLRVRDVMVPRVDVVMCEVSASREEVLALACRSGHTKIPLYEGTIDRVVGVVYIKDLFAAELKEAREVAREVPFVPAGKALEALLQALLERKVHLAVALGEYGGTAGIVTLEDIVEEIVGELQDEYDAEKQPFARTPDGRFSLSGRMSTREFSELFGTNLECSEVSTLGGLAMFVLGRLPQPGDELEYGGVHFTVESVRHRRVERIIAGVPTQAGNGAGRRTGSAQGPSRSGGEGQR